MLVVEAEADLELDRLLQFEPARSSLRAGGWLVDPDLSVGVLLWADLAQRVAEDQQAGVSRVEQCAVHDRLQAGRN